MPICKGLRGGDFLSATMPKAGSEAPKNTTPSLVELASVLGSMGFHRAVEWLGFGATPQEEKLLKFNSNYSNAWLDWACQRSNTRIVKRIIKE